jgi:hypothetical protein
MTVLNAGTVTVGRAGTPRDFAMRNVSVLFTNDAGGLLVPEPGSRVILSYTGSSGQFRFDNAGVITQDNVSVLFDWAATANNTASARDFFNGGTWVLKNGSAAASYTSASRPLTWCLMGSGNAGEMRLLSGSSVDFRTFLNSGTLELGADTVLAGPTFIGSNPALHNRGGTVLVSGDTLFGATNSESGTVTFNNGSASSTGSVLTVGNGADTPTLTVMAGAAVVFSNFATNTVTVNAGATLALRTFDDGISHPFNSRGVTVNNAGVLNLAGRLQQGPNHYGDTTIDNDGTIRVAGAGAMIQRLPNASSGYPATRLINRAGSLLTGTGTLAYSNSTGSAQAGTNVVTQYGTVAPGDPVGTLELVNTSVTFSDGTLDIQLYDAATFDKLKLAGLGKLDLAGANDVLAVSLYDRYRWGTTTTFRIFEGAPVTGAFESTLWHGGDSTGNYTVTYGANYIDIDVRGPAGTMVLIQ